MKFKRYTYNGVTVQATGRRSSSRENKKYERTVRYQDSERTVHYGDPELPMRRNNDEARANFLSRHSCDEKRDPFAPGFWACYDWANPSEKAIEMDHTKTALKMLNDGRVGGYLVVFGDETTRDLDGDYFTPETDFALDWYDKRPVLYQHGFDSTLKSAVVGVIDTLKRDSVGLWAEAQLKERDEYVSAIRRLIEEGKLNWSSGAMPHLVERARDGQLKRWVIVEGSLTPTPAEPRLTDVATIKSAYKDMGADSELETLLQGLETEPEALPEAADEGGGDAADGTSKKSLDNEKHEVNIMTDVQMPPADAVTREQLKAEIKGLENSLLDVLNKADNGEMQGIRDSQKALESEIKRLQTALSNIPDGIGGAAPAVDPINLGEVALELKSIRRGEGAPSEKFRKNMSGITGASGGHLLPERMSYDLLITPLESDPILGLVQVVDVQERKGSYPVPKFYGATAAGQSPLAGGVTGAGRGEGAAYTGTDMSFEDVEYNISNAFSGKVQVSKELVKDSPISLQTILQNAIRNAMIQKAGYFIFNGNGVNQPLGILNSGAVRTVTPATNGSFLRADVSEMIARLYAMDDSRVRWIAHKSRMAAIDALDTNTYNVLAVMTNGQQRMIEAIKQYPLSYSFNVPQAESTGSVNLVDFSQYLLFRRVEANGEGFELNYFDQNSLTHDIWTFDARMDGQPVQRTTIAYPDPSGTGYVVSPFVAFADTSA